MIVDEHIQAYINSLATEQPEYLRRLENQALADEVPIVRKEAQTLLRFLLTQKQPKQILEVGTAVGFSCSLMSEYMPADCSITTVEKVEMRITEAVKNLANARRAKDITLLIGDALDVLKYLNHSRSAEGLSCYHPHTKEMLPAVTPYDTPKKGYDFIFMDAAKGQYMNFLPEILKLLPIGGLLITDNVLQEGSIAMSKFSITRRDRTIHKRMREYLYTITHREELSTVVLPVGDGITLSTRIK